MKRTGLCVLLTVCMFSVPSIWAQSTVTTSGGTANKVAKFTGSTTISDSVITEASGAVGIGTTAPSMSLQVFSFSDANPFDLAGGPSAIRGEMFASTGAGILGIGPDFGTAGVTFNAGGIGIEGNNAAADGNGGSGVHGQVSSTNGYAFGVRGSALGSSGAAAAIFGEAFSPNGYAGLFINRARGNILEGQVGPSPSEVTVFRVDGHGTVFANGGFRPFGADFAEALAVRGRAEQYAPGDLLVIDASGERRLSLSQTPYSTLVAGIYSTQPGVVASPHRVDEALAQNEIPLAVVGIVPCKVSAENGPIQVGDLLVTSSTAGYAMKGTDRSRMLGAVVGKALEPLRSDKGLIEILVTLQ